MTMHHNHDPVETPAMAWIWKRPGKTGNSYVVQYKDEATGRTRSVGTYHRRKDAEAAKHEVEKRTRRGRMLEREGS